MNFALLCSLISAAVWLLLVHYLYRRGALGRVAGVLLAVIPLLAGNAYYYGLLQPEQRREAQLVAAQARLAALPAWRIIRVQQPDLFRQASQQLDDGLRGGLSEQQVLERLRPLAADLLNRRVNTARDDDLRRYVQVSLEQMIQLRNRGAEPCFRFLFPQVEGGVNLSQLLPQALMDSEMLAMDRLLANSRGPSPSLENAERARQQLQQVVRTLYGRWGSQLQMLNSPADPGANKALLCDMSVDLYQSVLALTGNDSASVLRIILSGTGS